MNLEELCSNLGLDKEEYVELLELLVGSGSEDISHLKQAVANNDAEQAARAAHSLKGAAANLGLTDLSETAREAEMQAKEGSLLQIEEKIKILQAKLDEIAALTC
ncbi:MAG: Hpt domain-containing protein [Deltaproteobacteria bacterium]|nr:MAG: Hpt domain-containing protein [Deltaproteobacteria bacterium]